MSLRQYTLEVLAHHCAQPTMAEWLADLEKLPPVATAVSGAEAVRRARAEDEKDLLGARPGP